MAFEIGKEYTVTDEESRKAMDNAALVRIKKFVSLKPAPDAPEETFANVTDAHTGAPWYVGLDVLKPAEAGDLEAKVEKMYGLRPRDIVQYVDPYTGETVWPSSREIIGFTTIDSSDLPRAVFKKIEGDLDAGEVHLDLPWNLARVSDLEKRAPRAQTITPEEIFKLDQKTLRDIFDDVNSIYGAAFLLGRPDAEQSAALSAVSKDRAEILRSRMQEMREKNVPEELASDRERFLKQVRANILLGKLVLP